MGIIKTGILMLGTGIITYYLGFTDGFRDGKDYGRITAQTGCTESQARSITLGRCVQEGIEGGADIVKDMYRRIDSNPGSAENNIAGNNSTGNSSVPTYQPGSRPANQNFDFMSR